MKTDPEFHVGITIRVTGNREQHLCPYAQVFFFTGRTWNSGFCPALEPAGKSRCFRGVFLDNAAMSVEKLIASGLVLVVVTRPKATGAVMKQALQHFGNPATAVSVSSTIASVDARNSLPLWLLDFDLEMAGCQFLLVGCSKSANGEK